MRYFALLLALFAPFLATDRLGGDRVGRRWSFATSAEVDGNGDSARRPGRCPQLRRRPRWQRSTSRALGRFVAATIGVEVVVRRRVYARMRVRSLGPEGRAGALRRRDSEFWSARPGTDSFDRSFDPGRVRSRRRRKPSRSGQFRSSRAGTLYDRKVSRAARLELRKRSSPAASSARSATVPVESCPRRQSRWRRSPFHFG